MNRKILAESAIMLNLYPVAEKKKKAENKTQQDKRKTWSAEPEDNDIDLMKKALEVTGESRTEILLRCFRRDLKAVVREILEERERAKKDFFSDDKGSSASKG